MPTEDSASAVAAGANAPADATAIAATPTMVAAVLTNLLIQASTSQEVEMRKALLFPIALALGAAGPFSKFEQKSPTMNVETKKSLEDVERCLLDTDNIMAPAVYSQPDRPNVVNMLWNNGGGISIARAELTRTTTGTKARIWTPFKQFAECLPS